MVDNGVFVIHLCLIGIGFADFISDAYASSCYAGFRIDVDDAHNAFIGNDFPHRKYAVDTSMDIGHTSGTLVYSGSTETYD